MNRRLAGKLAQSRGNGFEKTFKNCCEIQGIEIERIPNGCRNVGRRLVRTKTPFDFVLGYKKRAAFIDVKMTKEKHFKFSKIKPHQLKALLKMSSGGFSGYVICIQDKVWFVDVSILNETKPGESVKLDYARSLGTITAIDARKIFE